jgi:parallel beta-helix repeat protein
MKRLFGLLALLWFGVAWGATPAYVTTPWTTNANATLGYSITPTFLSPTNRGTTTFISLFGVNYEGVLSTVGGKAGATQGITNGVPYWSGPGGAGGLANSLGSTVAGTNGQRLVGTGDVPVWALGPYIVVTDPPYNTDNTGVLDSSTAIQNAINAVSTNGGGTVYLPGGSTYLLKKTLYVSNNVTLLGAGMYSGSRLKVANKADTLLTTNATAGDVVLNVTSTTGFIIGQDVTLFDNILNTYGNGDSGRVLSVDAIAKTITLDTAIVHNYTVANAAHIFSSFSALSICRIVYALGLPNSINGFTNVTIRDLEIDGNKANQTAGNNDEVQCGVHDGNSHGLRIMNCYIHDTIFGGILSSHYIDGSFDGSEQILIAGNVVKDVGARSGLHFHGVKKSIVINNTLNTPGTSGLYMYSCFGNTLTDNNVFGATVGYDIIDSGTNTISGGYVNGHTTFGVSINSNVETSDRNNINNLVIVGGTYGVIVQNSSPNVSITECRIVSTSETAIYATANNPLISNNNVIMTGASAAIYSGQLASIVGNDVTKSAFGSAIGVPGSNSIVAYNRINSGAQTGIDNLGKGNVVIGNQWTGTSGTPIANTGTNYVEFGNYTNGIPISSYTSDLIPSYNSQYDLGSASMYWRTGYIGKVASSNLTVPAGGSLTLDASNGVLIASSGTVRTYAGTDKGVAYWNSAGLGFLDFVFPAGTGDQVLAAGGGTPTWVDTAGSGLLLRASYTNTFQPANANLTNWAAAGTNLAAWLASNQIFTDSNQFNAGVSIASAYITNTWTPTINGGGAANDDITIQGTTNATRGSSYVNLQPNGGNVGIGITTPQALLHIWTTNDTTDENAAFWLGSGTTGYQQLFMGINRAYGYSYIGANSASAAYNNLILNPNGGKVGIGTTNPAVALEVPGTTYLGTASITNLNFPGQYGIVRSVNGTYAFTTDTGTAYGLPIWSSTGSAFLSSAAGTDNQILVGRSSTTPIWTNNITVANLTITNGTFSTPIVVGGSASLTANMHTYLMNVNSGMVTLPTAIGCMGREYIIKLITPCDACAVTNFGSGQLIDGADHWDIAGSNKVMKVQSDGTNWWITNQY